MPVSSVISFLLYVKLAVTSHWKFSETTGLLDLQAGKEGVLRVWSTGGLLLIETNNRAEFEKKMKQLPAGVYIVNGKKIIK